MVSYILWSQCPTGLEVPALRQAAFCCAFPSLPEPVPGLCSPEGLPWGQRKEGGEKKRGTEGRRVCEKLGGGGGWEASPPLPTYLTKLYSFSA